MAFDRSKLSKKEFIKYKARDGLTIPAYLSKRTFDAGGNYFVILPHGGPNVKQKSHLTLGYSSLHQEVSMYFNLTIEDLLGMEEIITC